MKSAQSSAPQFELVFPGVSLSAFTRLDADGNERKYIGGTASSTAKDLKGSIIKPQAQVQMLEKLRGLAARMSDKQSGMTAWVNHSYVLPEDCLGAFTGASLVTRKEGDDDFIDLDIECRVTETNPRAVAAYEQVKDGIRHGWSIGAYFTDIEWISDDPKSEDYLNYYVTGINLLEVSLVGIPANQRAWVRDAASAREYAVKRAEAIASDSRSVTQRRELVTRSILERRSPLETERLAMAQDFRERSQQTLLSDESRQVLIRAADALEARDDGQELSPDDMRDRIGLGMSHLAKAVGHGLCVKSATHVAKAIDCLGAMMGASTTNPSDPENDQNNMHADEDELQARTAEAERDVEAKRAETATLQAQADALATQVAERQAELDAVAVKLEADSADANGAIERLNAQVAVVDAEVSEQRAEAERVAAEVAAAVAKRDAANAALEASRAELEAVKADIETRKAERMGRLGQGAADANALLAARNQTEMTPEHYNQTYSQRQEALRAQVRGNREPLSGRDIAAGLK